MTGSHEVRGSIPLGSTNNFRGYSQTDISSELSALRLRFRNNTKTRYYNGKLLIRRRL